MTRTIASRRILGVMRSGEKLSAEALRWLRHAPAGLSARSMSEPRLGVLSGTFNPPTRAHLALAEYAAQVLPLDEVLFVLPEIPPHKKQLEASLDDRAEMLVRAIAGHAKFSAAITSRGLFLDIHRAVAPYYPARTQMFFLTGRDAAERILLDWPYPDPRQALDEMFARFQFVVAQRKGPFVVPADSLAAQYVKKIHSLVLPAELEEISATQARERMLRGQPVKDLVPAEVASYIQEHGLYSGASRS